MTHRGPFRPELFCNSVKMLRFYVDYPSDAFMSKNSAFLINTWISCNCDSAYLLSFS